MKIVSMVALWAGVGLASLRAEPVTAAQVATRVEAVLATDGAGARLRGATLTGARLELDLGAELARLGLGSAAFEAALRRVHRAAAEVLREPLAAFEIITLIDGVPLDRLLDADERPARARSWTAPQGGLAPVQALRGRRIAVSPGHGYYLNGTSWVLQRGFWNGIVEDFVNHDIVTYLQAELAAAGADVRSTRNLDRAAGNGESGFPKWQEAARYHVKALGAAESVWNEAGFTHLEQDIRCRPRYANAVEADILVSIHNNGAGTPGAGTGTETLYDTNNGFGAESRRLADILHGRVIAAIRRDFDPGWVDRRVQGFNGSYGENRLATRPSVLIEVAFMDRPSPDNAALREERFKRLVAAAIRDGVQEYFEGRVVPPAASTLVAAAGYGSIGLTWRDNADSEDGFRIERRIGPNGPWEVIARPSANATTFTDGQVSPGTTYTYRVFSYNTRGDPVAASNEVTATAVALQPDAAAWLANLSIRTTLAAEQRVIVGLVVDAGARDVLMRGVGPALGALGLSGAMTNPRMELYSGSAVVAQNDDWPETLAPSFAAVGAFPYVAGSRDAALLAPLTGARTVHVTGATGGVALVEAYDAGSGGRGRLMNVSSRNRVGTGGDVLIAGFHVAGTGTRRLLVRGVGPALAGFGVTGALADPRLQVFDSTGALLAENDSWDRALAATFASAGAFALPLFSRDAALILEAQAGRSYTAHVSGVNNTTGEALVEVYEIP